MLTESEARDLLALAGATVEVSPVTTMPDVPPRRRWPVLAAAAAVLAVVGVGAALGLQSGDDSPVGGETVPRVDFQGRPDVLAEDQLPSVFGYSDEDARAMLTGLGLAPSIRHEFVACNQPGGRALRTEPAVGTHFEPGDSVVLYVGRTPSAPCPMNADTIRAWQLIDFANGRGAAPAFADEVWVSANDENTVIPGALAADPATWVDGSPLGVLRQQSREVEEATGYTYRVPFLDTRPSGLSRSCGGLDLSGVPRSEPGFGITIDIPDMDPLSGCTVVDVFRTNGKISAISLRTDQVPLETTAPGTVPDLIGMSADEARAALADQGLVAEVVPPPGTKLCLRELPAIVGTQSHASGTELAQGSVVTVALRWVSCEESPSGGPDPFVEGQRLASAFLEFALGARPGPPVDTPVSLYLGNQLIRVLDDADASDRAAWDVCPQSGGYAEASCPFSAIRTLTGRGVDDFTVSGDLPAATPCPVELAPPPTNVGGSIVGSITNGSQQSCMDYAEVIVYANDVGQIVGVNLLLGSP